VLVRIGVHVPALPALQEPYSVVSTSGSVVFPAAAAITILALAATIYRLRALLPAGAWPVLALTTAAFPLLGLYAAVSDEHSDLETPLILLYGLAVVPLGVALTVSVAGAQRLAALMVTLALSLSAAAALAVVNEGGDSSSLATAGEALFLVFLASAPFAVATRGPFNRRAAILAGIAALLVLSSQLRSGSTTNILFLWSLGMTGGLPFVLYATAVAGLVYAVAAQMRGGLAVPALGLLLVGLAGIGLHNTYQSTLQVLGLAVLLVAALQASLEPAPATVAADDRRLDRIQG
jgi:hypothetical protein